MWPQIAIVTVTEFLLCLNGILHGFQMKFIVDYISEKEAGLTQYGLFLILCRCTLMIVERLGNSHKDRIKNVSAARSWNLIRALIFDKVLKLGPGGHSEGQIMSLISKDAQYADHLFHLIAQVIHMALNTTFTSIFLFWFFGKSFLIVALSTTLLY
jgi:ABC-type transport system involved in cytochrome bd biosynthesis fused ATPase/permease subunit